MNKTKKKRFKMILFVICLIGVVLASQVMQAMATSTDPVTTTVSNFSQLYSAMIQAEDGDVIGISGRIDISGSGTVGFADKHITLRRMSSSSFFYISSERTFQNLTFDGDGISATSAYVITSANVAFQDVIFQSSLTNTANGGAVYVINSAVSFNNCTFDNNEAVQGGHIYVAGSANATIDNSTLKNGHALIDGGAIKNALSTTTTNITSSIITGNSADEFGGGLSNKGNMKIIGSKVFDNIAPNGADIANAAYGNLNLADSIEILVELFKDDGIIPTAWINDYDGSTSISDPDINPTGIKSLLKLDYEIPPTEVILAPSSLGSAGDGKITGLESGKYYKTTADDTISYSKADGTLTATESEAYPLVGTEIIDLTNGETYLVEEFTPAPTTVLIDSASLGTADSGKITGLTAGKMYKVLVDGTTNYTKADGSLSSNESEAEALTGTEIVGLVNGVTYLVEEYTPPVEEEPTDPGTDPETPGEEDPVDEEQPTDPEQESSSTTTTTTTTTDSNNTSNTTNTTNSTTSHNSDSLDESSTVNNYSYDHSTQSTTENTYLPSNDGSGEKGSQASASQNQTITVDYGSIVDGIKVQDEGKEITINVNVNVNHDTDEKDEVEPQVVEVASSNVEEVPSDISNITWVELVKICLLFGIFICVFRRPIAK